MIDYNLIMLKTIYNICKNPTLIKPNYRLQAVPEILSMKDRLTVNYVIFDKDDTLVPLHEFEVKDQRIIETIVELREMGIKVFVVSNSVKQKMKE